MDFLVQFLWYLLAFALGALVAYLIATQVAPHRSAEDAFADLPGARPNGDQR